MQRFFDVLQAFVRSVQRPERNDRLSRKNSETFARRFLGAGRESLQVKTERNQMKPEAFGQR